MLRKLIEHFKGDDYRTLGHSSIKVAKRTIITAVIFPSVMLDLVTHDHVMNIAVILAGNEGSDLYLCCWVILWVCRQYDIMRHSHLSIQTSVLDRFGDMRGFNVFGAGEVGYGAADFEDAAVRSCAQAEFVDRDFQ